MGIAVGHGPLDVDRCHADTRRIRHRPVGLGLMELDEDVEERRLRSLLADLARLVPQDLGPLAVSERYDLSRLPVGQGDRAAVLRSPWRPLVSEAVALLAANPGRRIGRGDPDVAVAAAVRARDVDRDHLHPARHESSPLAEIIGALHFWQLGVATAGPVADFPI